ncbi:Protein O-mannosyl-transferase TMTC3 [Gryllus bimaculatus]|nr:Protein O-mannosyl-transferase TMTC3 [Gryllus bimaculatus]
MRTTRRNTVLPGGELRTHVSMAVRHAFSAVLLMTCIACYYNSLQCGLVFDDLSAIRDNRDLRPHVPLKNIFFNDFWGTPIHKEQSHKSYRPLCVLTFRWNYALHQLEPMGYHLVNMLLHSVVCLMYYRMCSLFLPEISSFVAAMLFAVHPIHTEAVTGVVGRAETLSSVFFLAAFIFYTKSTKRKRVTGWQPLVLSMLSVATAMLCKEQGITVTGICAIYELIVAQKLRILDLLSLARTALSGKGSLNVSWQSEATKRLSVLAATTVCLLAVRLQIMGSRLPVFTRFDNPASVAPTPVRQLSYHYLISVNMWLLLFPCDLCCDWTMGTVPLIESFLDPRNIATVLSYVALLLLAYAAIIVESRHQSVVIIMSLAFLVLPFLPASNMFFPVGFVVAERILYIPSMGLCMLVGYGWGLFAQKHGRKLAWFLLGVLLLVHGCKTYHRNMDWENEYTIFMAGLRVNPRNAKLFNNVGHALEKQERFEEALQYFQKAVSVQEDDIGAHINVGRTFNHLKMFKEAEDAYLQAKSLLPKAKPGESYQARIAPNHLNVFLNLANLIARNETRLEEADLLYRQAISMRADYTQAYINRGDILLKLNRTKEAQEDNTNERVYFNLGMLAMDDRDVAGAEHWFRQAVQLKDDFRSALFNLALLLADDHRPLEAAPFLNQLVKFHPDHIKGLILLGDIYINNIKDLDAAENCYKRILQLDPENVQGLHNLCVVYVERGNLRRAEACLVRAHRLAPHEDYVLRHLNIVRSRIQKLQIPQDSEGEEFEDFEQYEGNSNEKSVNDIVDKVYEEDNEEVDQKESDTSPQHHKNKLPPKGQSGASTAGNSQLPENTKHVKNRVDSSTGTSGHTVPQRTHTVEKKVVNEQVSRKTSSQLPGRGSSQAQVPQFNDRKYMSQADQRRNSGPSYTEFQEQQPNSKTLTSHHSALKQHSSS